MGLISLIVGRTRYTMDICRFKTSLGLISLIVGRTRSDFKSGDFRPG